MKKITLSASSILEAAKTYHKDVVSAYEQIRMAVVAASFVSLRFYNTKNGVRMAIVRISIPNSKSYREFKLPLNQELFDAIISIWFEQEPKEIDSFDTTGWEAEPEEDFSFEVFKLLHEAGVQVVIEADMVKDDVTRVPAKVKNGNKFVIDFYLTLNEEIENYLKANNLR